jgi:hypothetical protein
MTSDKDNRSDLLERALIEIAVETWRFSRLFTRVLNRLDAGEQNRYATQLRYFQRKVEEHFESAGFKLVSVEGQAFDPGVAASAVNISDFGPDDKLLVEQMVEPIVMGTEGLRREGTILVRKAQA